MSFSDFKLEKMITLEFTVLVAVLPFLGLQYSCKVMIYIFSSLPCTKIVVNKYKS